jgi:hypothetical protein
VKTSQAEGERVALRSARLCLLHGLLGHSTAMLATLIAEPFRFFDTMVGDADEGAVALGQAGDQDHGCAFD